MFITLNAAVCAQTFLLSANNDLCRNVRICLTERFESLECSLMMEHAGSLNCITEAALNTSRCQPINSRSAKRFVSPFASVSLVLYVITTPIITVGIRSLYEKSLEKCFLLQKIFAVCSNSSPE